MAKGEYVLNIGDDNVVLVRLENKQVINAWLASPDPATALEELGEALAADKKGRVSVIIDTLDQANKEEEIPKVNILDRRKVLSRHITMAFPGSSLRGARLVGEGGKNTLLYEFASVPLDGRIPGWIEFYDSLPNEKGGIYAIASENVDIIKALAPKDAPPVEQGNHWRHFIGINTTGGLRQIIEKNGRLCLTRLTQAPPPDTPPDEFADMIIRDFKATITYLRRLGYAVGDPLDLVVLTTSANRAALDNKTWEGARSVNLLTPYEAGAMLGLGSIGPEDLSTCDVLHAAWFASKRTPNLKLTRSVAMGDLKDDLRELSFVVAPYAAGLIAASVLGWTAMTTVDYLDASAKHEELTVQLTALRSSLSEQQNAVAALPYDAARMRNVLEVESAMDRGKADLMPLLSKIYESLQSDAVVLNIKYGASQGTGQTGAAATGQQAPRAVNIRLRMSPLISSADEAVQAARRLEQRLTASFAQGYQVKMTQEPVAAQAAENLTGGLFATAAAGEAMAGQSARTDEPFYVAFTITEGAPK
ncbi:MAG: hypothetical protein SFV19_12080 [Rhodospirillaceae bacterium]|nr:hypothetical protein [Rhodospirillaceae bacterium]